MCVEKKTCSTRLWKVRACSVWGATAEAAIADAASKLKLPADMDITPLAVVENLLANGELELVTTA